MQRGKWSRSKSLVIFVSGFYIIFDILLLGPDPLNFTDLLGVPMFLWLIIFVLSLICYAYQQKSCRGKMLFSEMMVLLRYSFFAMFLILNTLMISLWLFLLGLILTGQFDD